MNKLAQGIVYLNQFVNTHAAAISSLVALLTADGLEELIVYLNTQVLEVSVSGAPTVGSASPALPAPVDAAGSSPGDDDGDTERMRCRKPPETDHLNFSDDLPLRAE